MKLKKLQEAFDEINFHLRKQAHSTHEPYRPVRYVFFAADGDYRFTDTGGEPPSLWQLGVDRTAMDVIVDEKIDNFGTKPVCLFYGATELGIHEVPEESWAYQKLAQLLDCSEQDRPETFH